MAEPKEMQTRINETDVRKMMNIQFGITKTVLYHIAKAKDASSHINVDIASQNMYSLAVNSALMTKHVEEAYKALAGDGKTLA